MSLSSRRGLQIFFVALLVTFIVVANVPAQLLAARSAETAERFLEALRGLFSLMLTYALAVSLWLLYRVYPVARQEAAAITGSARENRV